MGIFKNLFLRWEECATFSHIRPRIRSCAGAQGGPESGHFGPHLKLFLPTFFLKLRQIFVPAHTHSRVIAQGMIPGRSWQNNQQQVTANGPAPVEKKT